MRHNLKLKKLNRTSAHRKSMFSNLIVSILEHGQIKTTLPKAKAVRPLVERIITKAKVDNLANRRYVLSKLKSVSIVSKLFSEIGPMFKSRNGGYLRIIKAGFRTGDVAPMAVIEMVDKKKVAPAPKKEAKTLEGKKTEKVEKKESKKPASTKKDAKATKTA